MNHSDFINRITELLREFIDDEEGFGDGAQLRIDPKTHEATLVADPDEDMEEYDYYDVIDLLEPTVEGSFIPDKEKIILLADEALA